ncbi:MAG TPA: hypothetical protein VIL37_00370 [Natronosporangium sp.]
MTPEEVDSYVPESLHRRVFRAAVAAEGELIGRMVEETFRQNRDYYQRLFGLLAPTRGLVAKAQGEFLGDAAELLRRESDERFSDGVESITDQLLDRWEGAGASDFADHLGGLRGVLQLQYEVAVSLEHLLKLHGSVVLAAKEKIILIAEQTVEALADQQQVRQAFEAQRLRSLKDSILERANPALAGPGPWAVVRRAAIAVAGYLLDELTRPVAGEDALDILADMAASMLEVYEDFHTSQVEIWNAVSTVVNEYLTPEGSDSINGSPLVLPSVLAPDPEQPGARPVVLDRKGWVAF